MFSTCIFQGDAGDFGETGRAGSLVSQVYLNVPFYVYNIGWMSFGNYHFQNGYLCIFK